MKASWHGTPKPANYQSGRKILCILKRVPNQRQHSVTQIRCAEAEHSCSTHSVLHRTVVRKDDFDSFVCDSVILTRKQEPEMGNVLFSIIWLIILIFIGFWVAGIAAGIYIIVIPFTVCIEPLTGLTDFLLSVIQFPKYCAQAMVDGKGFN